MFLLLPFFLAVFWPFTQAGEICGSRISQEKVLAAESRFKAAFAIPNSVAKRQLPSNVLVTVTWHVISANDTSAGGQVSNSQIEDTIKTLNEGFRGKPISFTLDKITRTRNATWYRKAFPETIYQKEMKKALREGGVNHLNLFSVGFEDPPTLDDDGLLGYSTFPSDYFYNPGDDGIVINAASVRGGSLAYYNLGGTVVHETGHWFGLYHTFRGGCTDPFGDFVDDTAPEANASTGCERGLDTCPGNGPDPISNFMDYSYDTCLTGFTDGQLTRAAQQWIFYRSS